jgi:predicted Rdx family selenoprotein
MVTINQEALQQVAAEVTPSAVSATLGSRFPVKCDDVESQVWWRDTPGGQRLHQH